MAGPVVRVAALADLHCTKTSQGAFQTLFARVSESADILVIAGDLTDNGLAEEAAVLARELSALRVPAAAVLGNHDLESGKSGEVSQILNGAGLTVLDGDACELQGIGIAGVKGFGGGFGRHALGPWGETIIKQFVHEAVNEALKLEAAFARLRPAHPVALCTTRRFSRRSRASRWKSIRFSARAASRSRSAAIRYRSRCTATRSVGSSKDDQERRARVQRVDAFAHADVRRSAAVPRFRGAADRHLDV
jgi:Predicted phosphoesterases, related to the Icc protein